MLRRIRLDIHIQYTKNATFSAEIRDVTHSSHSTQMCFDPVLSVNNLLHTTALVQSPLVRISLVQFLEAVGIKFVLVEFVISKLVEFSLCTTQLVRISHTMLGQKSI